jgi:GNAT superfamily N-acetyltransferase
VNSTLIPSGTPTLERPPHVDSEPDVRLRPLDVADTEDAARIVFEAFTGIAARHGFPSDFPTLESARQLVAAFTAHPSIWAVAAELDGRLVGSNFLDERGPICGVGPISVDPDAQAAGVGRRLMEAALERGGSAVGVRLLQDSFNAGSLALYASLGFEVAEPIALVAGVPSRAIVSGIDVRPLVEADLEACEQLCIAVHGVDRTAELLDALTSPGLTPVAALRDGRVVAYATTLFDLGVAYAVAETEDDLFALIAGAVTPDGPPASFLLPLRQHALARRCLAAGLRIVKPMTYMVVGPYARPRGAWIPSVLY